MNKKFLLLAGAFGVAATAAIFSDTASALTNSQVSGISLAQNAISTSFDGRYIAFLSPSTSLVSGDTNNVVDAFLRDTQTGTTTRISVSTAGAQADGATTRVILSGNGKYALMTSKASTLASGGGYNANNVYLRDLTLGQTYLIAAGSNGLGTSQDSAALSEDGRFIYYRTNGGANSGGLVMYDRSLGTTTRIDADASGTAGNAGVTDNVASTTCDGRFAVFSSAASNLVNSDTNGQRDIFLVDSMNGHTIKNLTISADGQSQNPTITCDGNYILFYSDADNLVSGDTNSATDVFEYSVANDTIQRVDLDPSGNQYGTQSSSSGGVTISGDNSSRIASMDGRYVVFGVDKYSSGSQTSGQIFLRDTVAGTTTALSPIGGNTFAELPTTTYDGRTTYYLYSTSSTGVFSKNVYSATDYL